MTFVARTTELKSRYRKFSSTMIDSIVDRQVVLRAIFATIDEINEIQPEGQELGKLPETHLFGQQGKLDSLGLVNFIVSLEQRIAEEFGAAITLADEKALSREKSPFLTIESLTDYVIEQIEGLRQ
jgi:acyl carrier protein